MIFSAQQIFSDDQAITVDAISTNVIDLGVPGTPFGAAAAVPQDQGKGVEIPILVQVTTAFATIVSMTITIEVSAAAALTSPTVLFTSPLILLADLIPGKQITCRVLPNDANLRYLGIRYDVNTTATAGNITAGITMGNQNSN